MGGGGSLFGSEDSKQKMGKMKEALAGGGKERGADGKETNGVPVSEVVEERVWRGKTEKGEWKEGLTD